MGRQRARTKKRTVGNSAHIPYTPNPSHSRHHAGLLKTKIRRGTYMSRKSTKGALRPAAQTAAILSLVISLTASAHAQTTAPADAAAPAAQAQAPEAALATPPATPPAAAPKPAAPKSRECTRLPLSDIQAGKEKTIEVARLRLGEYAEKVAKQKGWKSWDKSLETVTCEEYLWVPILGQEYKCLIAATFCKKS